MLTGIASYYLPTKFKKSEGSSKFEEYKNDEDVSSPSEDKIYNFSILKDSASSPARQQRFLRFDLKNQNTKENFVSFPLQK